jgi:hypothetical protein
LVSSARLAGFDVGVDPIGSDPSGDVIMVLSFYF